MSHYLEALNQVQQESVCHFEGPMLVIAGPGSGKTRVLTYRIAHLIQHGISPWNILALTFTNKAAKEMRERITNLAGDEARNLWMGTFHSIFARILRIEAEHIGFPKDFAIYDTQDTISVINQVIKELKLDKKQYNPNSIRARISSAKTNVISSEEYPNHKDLLDADMQSNRPYFYKIYKKYNEKLRIAGAMDFDDLLYYMFCLLRDNEAICNQYRQKFQYVLVDEFQDTNYIQYEIVKKLTRYPGSRENLCVVGDDAQSIYAFRGATIDNILDLKKDFERLKVFKLEQNYRSTVHIVEAANSVISHNSRQIKKKIWTAANEGNPIKLVRAITDTEEGKRVADLILEYKNRYHISNTEIAVLYRTNAQSRVFEEQLRRQNIPYKVFGGFSFYQRKEVKDVLAYMRLVLNSGDVEAFKRVVNYPKRGIGITTVDKILANADAMGVSAWEAIGRMDLPQSATRRLADFKNLIRKMKKKSDESDVYEAAVYITKASGIYDLLRTDTSIEGMNRLANVNALLDGIRTFADDDVAVDGSEQSSKTLSAYVQNIALLTDMDQESETQDYVSLMSVHAAKGLEFSAVFLVGMEENLFPSFLSMGDPKALEEERRLFYVAITRAKKYLTLSYANSRYQFGSLRYNERSRFLDEIPEHHLEESAPQANAGIGSIGSFRTGSRVAGLKPLRPIQRFSPKNYPDFVHSPMHLIQSGVRVLHQKFGPGTVIKIDGAKENKIATIKFEEIDVNPVRKIMLRFAKLMLLED